jgi:Sel1 repeat
MLADIGRKPPLPALVSRALTPRRAARVLPVGILLYLFSVGVVAAATVGILFGIGFFLLAQPKEAMNAGAGTGEHDSHTKIPLPTLSNASSSYGDIASAPIEPPIPRSAASAALPVVTVAPPAARPSPAGDVPAGDAKDQSFAQGAPELEARAASPEISLPAALAPEPAPGSSTATSAAEPAPGSSTATSAAEPAPGSSTATSAAEDVSRLSAGQITELLARGDSFLHSGDVASARLFYERAADAGDWQAAIRMGATFDATFLGRVGVRAVGDPIKAQSWYTRALDLGAPKADRQVESPKAK